MADEVRSHTHITERTTVPVTERTTTTVADRGDAPVERRVVNQQAWYTGAAREPAAAIRRVSWAAVFAGVVVALVVQLLLSLLGIGIGASTLNALTEQDPASGLGTRAGIWFGLTSLIAIFLGGWVAGRLAGIPRRTDSLLHGVLTWSVATLLLFYFLTSTVGNLIGGTFRVLGAGLTGAATTVAAAAPSVAGAARDEMRERGIDATSLRREIETTLRQTRSPELQPDAIRDQVSDAAASDAGISEILSRLGQSGESAFNAADRESLVNVVAARTGQPRAQAEQTVATYERRYQEMRSKYQETRANAEQQAREVADRAAGGVTKAALTSFFALLIGAIAGALGGWLATPRDLPARAAATT